MPTVWDTHWSVVAHNYKGTMQIKGPKQLLEFPCTMNRHKLNETPAAFVTATRLSGLTVNI